MLTYNNLVTLVSKGGCTASYKHAHVSLVYSPGPTNKNVPQHCIIEDNTMIYCMYFNNINPVVMPALQDYAKCINAIVSGLTPGCQSLLVDDLDSILLATCQRYTPLHNTECTP